MIDENSLCGHSVSTTDVIWHQMRRADCDWWIGKDLEGDGRDLFEDARAFQLIVQVQ